MMSRKKGRRHAPTNLRPLRNDAEIAAIDAVLDALVIPPDPDKNLRFKRSENNQPGQHSGEAGQAMTPGQVD